MCKIIDIVWSWPFIWHTSFLPEGCKRELYKIFENVQIWISLFLCFWYSKTINIFFIFNNFFNLQIIVHYTTCELKSKLSLSLSCMVYLNVDTFSCSTWGAPLRWFLDGRNFMKLDMCHGLQPRSYLEDQGNRGHI